MDANKPYSRGQENGPADEGRLQRMVGRPVPERDDIGMLRAAANAIGLRHEWHHGCGDALHLTAPDATAIYWNPLRSDADALALAVRMEMDVFVRAGRWTEAVRPMGPACKEPHHGDPLAATRRAIVRAAVEVAPHALADDSWRAKPNQPLPNRRKTPNVGGEARLAAHQPSHTTTATPQGVASTDQLGRVEN